VELGLVQGDADAVGRLVAGDGMVLGAHVEIELAAQRVGQRPDAGSLLEEVVHAIPSKNQHS
jgi:hypothetical protein